MSQATAPPCCAEPRLGQRLGVMRFTPAPLPLSPSRASLCRRVHLVGRWQLRSSQNAGAVAEREGTAPKTKTSPPAAEEAMDLDEAAFPKPKFELMDDTLSPAEAIMMQGTAASLQ